MTRRIVFGLAATVLVATIAIPIWVFAAPGESGDVAITLQFQWIRQGRVGTVRVTGENLASVRAMFQDRLYYFYPDDEGFTGLLSTDMDGDIGDYPLYVWVEYTDGTTERLERQVAINHGEFGRTDITLPQSMVPLLEPEVENAEMDRLFNIFERFTPERFWAGGFTPPSTGELIGWFGTWRLYNGTYWKRHTGLDVKMPIGTSIPAVAAGRVVLAQDLDIRGGYVLIDHGWGVYSGYAHLSERFVVPGQWVRQGDVIGLSGMNGRSTGAHLHWEMAVGGAWAEPEEFISLGLDAAP